jgi:hypothetical protein
MVYLTACTFDASAWMFTAKPGGCGDQRGLHRRSGVDWTQLLALIQDLHTSIAAGRDVAELLELATLLHTPGDHRMVADRWRAGGPASAGCGAGPAGG